LEAAVPSSTVVWSSPRRPAISETQTYARALRVILEQLDDLVRERNQLVLRAKRLADADDISVRIVKEAAGLERWAEVQPSMFEDSLDQELAKYDKFRRDIEDSASRQSELLENMKERVLSAGYYFHLRPNVHFVQVRMHAFISSRKEDPSVKEREHALQSLDLSYHKYKEIVRHLDDGIQVRFFYCFYLRRVLERLFLIVLQRPDGVVDPVQRELRRMGDGPTVRAKVNQQFYFVCHF
jgi:programmed cell death 6-interacting protein